MFMHPIGYWTSIEPSVPMFSHPMVQPPSPKVRSPLESRLYNTPVVGGFLSGARGLHNRQAGFVPPHSTTQLPTKSVTCLGCSGPAERWKNKK
jgi:hypothetical protein